MTFIALAALLANRKVSWGQLFSSNVTFLALLLTHCWVFCNGPECYSILICDWTIKHLLSAFFHSYQIKYLNITVQKKKTNRLCKRREGETSVMGFMGIVSHSVFDVTSLNRRLTEQALVLFRDCYGTHRCRETCSLLIKLSEDCHNLPWEVTAANSYSVVCTKAAI